jgi:hypothetical protein
MNLLYLFGGRFFWVVKRFKMVTALHNGSKNTDEFFVPDDFRTTFPGSSGFL